MGTHLFRLWGWAGVALGLCVSSVTFAADKSCGDGTWLRVKTTGHDVLVERAEGQPASPPPEKGADGCYKVSKGKYVVKFSKDGQVKGTVGAIAVEGKTKVVRFKE